VAETKPFFQRIARRAPVLAYALATAWFLWVCAQFYLPGKGFTYLIMFGERDAARFLPELKAQNHYEIPGSTGYDAAYYAQLAMHPQLRDPVLRTAIDSLPYRARRILFCWTANALALGDPARALHIYAVQNIACWLLLAALLLRWFPATSWGNFFRWAGVLFSFGLCFSVRGALVDGPSLLLIAAGVALAEMGRPWWSAALLGLSGLGKETNVLAGAAFAPTESSRPAWLNALARGAIVVLPLVLWLALLQVWLGGALDEGYRNFAPPFVAYVGKWREILAGFRASSDPWAERGSVILIVALTTQFLFFALRPRWKETWWRVGAAYAVLMALIGEAVWEGYPGAASRVLLPMALAFNVLVPRGIRWWPVLLLGNLTFLLTPDAMQPPEKGSYELSGPRALRVAEADGRAVSVNFDDNWFGGERSRWEYWRWSRGTAGLIINNPHPFPVLAKISFTLSGQGQRSFVVREGAQERWRGTLGSHEPKRLSFSPVRLEPGENRWRFETDQPAQHPASGDPRELAINLRNLEIKLTGKADR
jgi:hypothetical protein